MATTLSKAFAANFLGQAPVWYKLVISGFLVLNPLLLMGAGPFVAGWALLAEFIFCLAMAVRCYPLQPGGLLAIQAVMLGLTSPQSVYHETSTNFPVILLLMFMVAGIYFMKDLLLYCFSRLLVGVQSKVLLSLLFCGLAAVLSAFLDALTVIAVVITVGQGFYLVYHKVASGYQPHQKSHDVSRDDAVADSHRSDLNKFRGFLRDIVMHAAIGTALGGACTLVGEPQNLLIGKIIGWEFVEYFLRMAPVSVPVLFVGLITCGLVEKLGWFTFGYKLPKQVRRIISDYIATEKKGHTSADTARLVVQGVAAVCLVLALGFHVAEVGLIGLMILVLQTALNGVTDEHRLGRAFAEALPFTALLVVFFGVVAVIHDQHLFAPIIHWGLAMEGKTQLLAMYAANGLLSMVSDNVFVATVYMSEMQQAFQENLISRDQFEHLAVAINAGTNIPSVATPNGQAAFLFLLTSSLAPVIRLSYGRMVWMALPYTITMSVVGALAVWFVL